VLFGLATLALLAGPVGLGLTTAQSAAARICTGIVWLAGLGAVQAGALVTTVRLAAARRLRWRPA